MPGQPGRIAGPGRRFFSTVQLEHFHRPVCKVHRGQQGKADRDCSKPCFFSFRRAHSSASSSLSLACGSTATGKRQQQLGFEGGAKRSRREPL